MLVARYMFTINLSRNMQHTTQYHEWLMMLLYKASSVRY